MARLKQDQSRYEIVVSSSIKARAMRICKDLGVSFTQLAKDALIERLEILEEKRQRLEERERAEKEAREGERPRFKSFKKLSMPIGGSRLPEVARPEALGTQAVAVAEVKDLPIEYAQYAKRLSEADSPTERRVRMFEAIREIQKRAPLTHPGESAIRETLDKLAASMRTEQPDPLVGKTISPEVLARAKTSRSPDVGEGEE